jgi:hypothetical protein
MMRKLLVFQTFLPLSTYVCMWAVAALHPLADWFLQRQELRVGSVRRSGPVLCMERSATALLACCKLREAWLWCCAYALWSGGVGLWLFSQPTLVCPVCTYRRPFLLCHTESDKMILQASSLMRQLLQHGRDADDDTA